VKTIDQCIRCGRSVRATKDILSSAQVRLVFWKVQVGKRTGILYNLGVLFDKFVVTGSDQRPSSPSPSPSSRNIGSSPIHSSTMRRFIRLDVSTRAWMPENLETPKWAAMLNYAEPRVVRVDDEPKVLAFYSDLRTLSEHVATHTNQQAEMDAQTQRGYVWFTARAWQANSRWFNIHHRENTADVGNIRKTRKTPSLSSSKEQKHNNKRRKKKTRSMRSYDTRFDPFPDDDPSHRFIMEGVCAGAIEDGDGSLTDAFALGGEMDNSGHSDTDVEENDNEDEDENRSVGSHDSEASVIASVGSASEDDEDNDEDEDEDEDEDDDDDVPERGSVNQSDGGVSQERNVKEEEGRLSLFSTVVAADDHDAADGGGGGGARLMSAKRIRARHTASSSTDHSCGNGDRSSLTKRPRVQNDQDMTTTPRTLAPANEGNDNDVEMGIPREKLNKRDDDDDDADGRKNTLDPPPPTTTVAAPAVPRAPPTENTQAGITEAVTALTVTTPPPEVPVVGSGPSAAQLSRVLLRQYLSVGNASDIPYDKLYAHFASAVRLSSKAASHPHARRNYVSASVVVATDDANGNSVAEAEIVADQQHRRREFRLYCYKELDRILGKRSGVVSADSLGLLGPPTPTPTKATTTASTSTTSSRATANREDNRKIHSQRERDGASTWHEGDARDASAQDVARSLVHVALLRCGDEVFDMLELPNHKTSTSNNGSSGSAAAQSSPHAAAAQAPSRTEIKTAISSWRLHNTYDAITLACREQWLNVQGNTGTVSYSDLRLTIDEEQKLAASGRQDNGREHMIRTRVVDDLISGDISLGEHVVSLLRFHTCVALKLFGADHKFGQCATTATADPVAGATISQVWVNGVVWTLCLSIHPYLSIYLSI
jgi:hypothetical protein